VGGRRGQEEQVVGFFSGRKDSMGKEERKREKDTCS
jgi:hypothetical protein